MSDEHNEKTHASNIARDLPDIPEDLITEFYRNNVVVFVGSGVSKWSKDDFQNLSPSWKEILLQIISQASHKGVITDENIISELTHLISSSDADIDDWLIAADFLVKECAKRNYDLSGYLYDELSRYKSHRAEPSSLGPIDLIARLPCRGFITTNYDKLIEDAYSFQGRNLTVLSANNDLALRYVTSTARPWLIKLHGRVGFSSRFVLSYQQYEDAYSDGSIETLISVLMSKYTLLFIGFGFRDPPIMDIIRNVSHRLGAAKRRHYAIGDSLSFGEIKGSFLSEHFNIEPIVYAWQDCAEQRKDWSHVEHANFPKTVERLHNSVEASSLISTRTLLVLNSSKNDRDKVQKESKFLMCAMKDAPNHLGQQTKPSMLFPSIEWTQLLYSDLKELRKRDVRPLKLDITEHLDLDAANFEEIDWYPIGDPFWDGPKPHLATGIAESRFYFQFVELDVRSLPNLATDDEILELFRARDDRYQYEWVSFSEIQKSLKTNDPSSEYNRPTLQTFVDLMKDSKYIH